MPLDNALSLHPVIYNIMFIEFSFYYAASGTDHHFNALFTSKCSAITSTNMAEVRNFEGRITMTLVQLYIASLSVVFKRYYQLSKYNYFAYCKKQHGGSTQSMFSFRFDCNN
jgi:hypothetical protein